MAVIRKELALAKLLAGAAWADGEVADAERERIARASAELGLSGGESAEVDAILAEPVGVAETEALAHEFLSTANPEERAELLRRLETVLLADGKLEAAERELLSNLRAWGEEPQEARSLLARMRGLAARSRAAATTPSASFERIRSRMRSTAPPGSLAPRDHERAVLFGAILYRTAFADGRVDPQEVAQLGSLLESAFGVGDGEREQILAVIRGRAAEEMDRQRLCASFNRVTTMEERFRLLGCLFAVAKADGTIDEDELREIRLVANYLWIDARSFNDVRLREV